MAQKIEIEAYYSSSADMTFVVKHVYRDGDLKSQEVTGFYYGEPNEADTRKFKNKLKATF